MAKKLLIINVGSSSQKYAFYLGDEQKFFAHFETLGDKFILRTEKDGISREKVEISQKDFLESSKRIIDLLKDERLIASPEEIDAIGFRVVHGGDKFFAPHLIDDDFIKELEAVKDLAPLHMEPVIIEIKEFMKTLPDVKKVAVFDTAFHKGLPAMSKLYGLPLKISQSLKVYRYGFHGISCQSIIEKLKEKNRKISKRIIICHLGSGVSITAVKNGKSFDTSMGFTPLEGVVMGTRVGDIDAGALVYLQQKLNLSPKKLDEFLNKECGLLGLSEKTADVRKLIELDKIGNEKARLALDIFSYRVKKYIGAYIAAMGGLDALVFTAAIGEGSPIMRLRICENLESLGIKIDQPKNEKIIDKDGTISSVRSKVEVLVLKTDEMREIAKQIKEFRS
jgi:acetate kinase